MRTLYNKQTLERYEHINKNIFYINTYLSTSLIYLKLFLVIMKLFNL